MSSKIIVIGVGSAGIGAINDMISSNMEGCKFVVFDTDERELARSLCTEKVVLGTEITDSLLEKTNSEVGEKAAKTILDAVLRYLDGFDMAFVVAGMGGGTGTGAAPIIARAFRQHGILTIGVVTKPFHFEGIHRTELAEKGIEEIQQFVNALIVIPNQNLFRIANEETTFAEAFKIASNVMQCGVRGITDLIVRPGILNLSLENIRKTIKTGKAVIGTGEASGENRAVAAAESAINSPLLNGVSIGDAQGVIVNVTSGYGITLSEVNQAFNRICDETDSTADILLGAVFDNNLEGTIRVSIIVTGIEQQNLFNRIYHPPLATELPEANRKESKIDEWKGKMRKLLASNSNTDHNHSYPPFKLVAPTNTPDEELVKIISHLSTLYSSVGGDELVVSEVKNLPPNTSLFKKNSTRRRLKAK